MAGFYFFCFFCLTMPVLGLLCVEDSIYPSHGGRGSRDSNNNNEREDNMNRFSGSLLVGMKVDFLKLFSLRNRFLEWKAGNYCPIIHYSTCRTVYPLYNSGFLRFSRQATRFERRVK